MSFDREKSEFNKNLKDKSSSPDSNMHGQPAEESKREPRELRRPGPENTFGRVMASVIKKQSISNSDISFFDSSGSQNLDEVKKGTEMVS